MGFGHSGAIFSNVCLDRWGAGPFRLEVEGQTFAFEFSEMFGPTVLDEFEDPLDVQPDEASPFWRAVTLWSRQGRRVNHGLAVWHEPKPTIVVVRKRQLVTLQEGEPNGLVLRKGRGGKLIEIDDGF